MDSIPIYAANFGSNQSFNPSALTLQGVPILSILQNAAPSANLKLNMDVGRWGSLSASLPSALVNDQQLKDGLAKLLGDSAMSSPAPVGLLLADTYGPAPGHYGFMFDLAGQLNTFYARQGCAIFVSAIRQQMQGKTEAEINEFVAFIALHEIGHAFNLWHLGDGGNSIMQPFPNPTAVLQADPKGAPQFNAAHCQYLAHLSDTDADEDASYYILPGGSPFGDRLSISNVPNDTAFAGPPSTISKLKFKAKLSHKTLWSFEPIELEINLSVSGNRALSVPDDLDPGYSSFQIWITRPDGERFRFHPLTRYCQPNGSRKITPHQPFRRDIAIFRHRGDNTFRLPGKYTVQAALRLFSGRFLLSNIASCEILPAEPSSPAWQAHHTLFRCEAVRDLFRYKTKPPPLAVYNRLMQLADQYASKATASALHYALGKAFLRFSTYKTAHKARARKLRENGVSHLRRALNTSNLSPHRTSIATIMLNGDSP